MTAKIINCKCERSHVLRKNHIIVARICDNCKKELSGDRVVMPPHKEASVKNEVIKAAVEEASKGRKEEKINGKKGFLKKGTIITDENDIENKGD